MKINKNTTFVVALCSLLGMGSDLAAKPNVPGRPGGKPGGGDLIGQLKTTATCRPAEAGIDLDINNVRARLMTGGDMWWDNGLSVARYEVPKGSMKNSLFAGSVWIGGFDPQRQLKVAGQTYRQSGNDYWPGPLDANAEIDANTCSEWDRFWKVNAEDINRFRELGDYAAAANDPSYDVIFQWPAKGNRNAVGRNLNNLEIPDDKNYAPFVDVSGPAGVPDGIYNAEYGDYPDIRGDQFIWWIFNDKGNTKGESQTEGIGVEIHASAFAYSTNDQLNDATFYNYKIHNRGNLTLDSTFIATWTDADLGYHLDDFIGCDTTRSLGILYNGRSEDGQGEPSSYGSRVPMVGIDFFQGPIRYYDSAGVTLSEELGMSAFTYYNNDWTVIGNPRNGVHMYGYMTGTITNGEHFTNDFAGPGIQSKGYGSGPITKFVYPGDPSKPNEWSECSCNNNPFDRRFIHSSGPFRLDPGVENSVTIGAIWVSDAGGCPNTSFSKIRVADDLAQALFDRNFETLEGPEAPDLTVREMDRKLIFYLTNPENSNNYRELYGRDTASKYRVNALTVKPKAQGVVADSLYKFEGYRVFQLRNGSLQPSDIYDENGEINTENAREVFQCDLKNGIKRIINYERNTDVSDTTWRPIVKVVGKDSGISHSFEVTIDQFASGADNRIVNYRNYYFLAIAYAHNDFTYDPITQTGGFDPKNEDSTQDIAYLESSKAAGGSNLAVVSAMPNPANGDMGTVLNSDYGSGVIIKRLEGRGNGGNFISIDEETEEAILNSPNHMALEPVYKPGQGPVDIKVIDPVKVKPHDWEIRITGPVHTDSTLGVEYGASWELRNLTNSEVIYSERNLSILNEQILEEYGLAVSIQQVARPGDDQVNGNGYISSDAIFMDAGKPWLAGVNDAEGSDMLNWIRAGGNFVAPDPDNPEPCNFNDNNFDTVAQVYESLLSSNSLLEGTWTAYTMGSTEVTPGCGFGTVRASSQVGLSRLSSVDVVFTSDRSKWTKVVVLEMQEDQLLAQGGARKFDPRSHPSWNGDLDSEGRPVYSTIPGDTAFSWFPGYAINQETGERLNIVFGEDSWLESQNGADMIWNPTSDLISIQDNRVNYLYGGKHVIYILETRYDGGERFMRELSSGIIARQQAYQRFIYTGFPLLNQGFDFLPLSEGQIPTETRIRIRVERPYARFSAGNTNQHGGLPLYSFSTKELAPTPLDENPTADKDELLSRIQAVPNPYYGYNAYELNRLDTRVRIINLPRKAVVSIYSLEGALIQRLTKDNANVSYIDWNVRNSKGMPISSGMYLMHVQAEGIGETVVRWFGAMRPIDVSTH